MAPTQPKRPMTAFFLYSEANRPAVLKEFASEDKGKQYKLAVKTLAERWRALPQAKKQPFETQAATAKAAYDKELEAFKAAGGVVERKTKRGAAKKDKDKNAPKKPVGGAYGIFLNENRAEIVKGLPAGASVITEVTKAAGARWQKLSAAAKAPYEAKYQAKLKEYTAAMEEYKASKGDAEEEDEEEEGEEEEAEEEEEAPAAKKTRGGKAGTATAKKVAKGRVAALGA